MRSVPPPGTRVQALVPCLLTGRERTVTVTILGPARRLRVELDGRAPERGRVLLVLVLVQVDGEARPRDIAVERLERSDPPRRQAYADRPGERPSRPTE